MALPDGPVFLIHQTYQGRSDLPAVGKAREDAEHDPPGLFLDFGAVHLRGIREDATNHGNLSPLVAGGARHDTKKRTHPLAPWVQRNPPLNRSEWDQMVNKSLTEQRTKLSVDGLIVPGADHSPAAFPNGIELQINAIRRAWSNRPDTDPEWLAHFSLHDDWLQDGRLIRFLLNLITDLPDEIGIALQPRFSRRDKGSDAATLAGLREIVRVLANDDRKVLLVRTGGLGWLAIAWGAWGFTAGRTQGTWLDSREEIRRRKGQPSPPRLERYFESQLLHHVLFPDHQILAEQTGYEQCPCPFCTKLQTDGWAARPAAQHDLYALSDLTRLVSGGDRAARRQAVRAQVEAAQNHWAQWSSATGLSPRATPAHLPTWRELV